MSGSDTQVAQSQMYDANGNLTAVDRFYQNGGLKEADAYQGNHLVSITQYGTDGSVGTVTDFAAGAKTPTEVDTYSHGVLAKQQMNGADGMMQTVNLFAADGKTVTETDSYAYNASNRIATETHSAGGGVFETDTFAYDAFGHLAQISKANAGGTVTEIDYFNNQGNLDSHKGYQQGR